MSLNARAATLIVDDDGAGDYTSANAAIAAASSGDTIRITGGADGVHNETHFSLAVGAERTTYIKVDKNLIIEGLSPAQTAVDGGNYSRAIMVYNGVTATIRNLTIQNARAHEGDAIYSTGALTVDNCIIQNNMTELLFGGITAQGREGSSLVIKNSILRDNVSDADAGAIYTEVNTKIINTTIRGNKSRRSPTAPAIYALLDRGASLEIINSTISENVKSGYPASVYGAVFVVANYGGASQLLIANSTISGNHMPGIKELIPARGYSLGGAALQLSALGWLGERAILRATIVNTSITGNRADHGLGGIEVRDHHYPTRFGELGEVILNLKNTIISDNFGGDCGNVVPGSVIEGIQINNLIQDVGVNACGLVDGVDGNQIGVDPRFGPLQDNGGDTQTHALRPESPAIDAGDPATCLATDQRGEARPADGDRDGVAVCDIGAFEAPFSNRPPEIGGTPDERVSICGVSGGVVEFCEYRFKASLSDADGDIVTCTADNVPPWAMFDNASCTLVGTPTAAHVGKYDDIRIRVSDGFSTVGLAPFSILVDGPNVAPSFVGGPDQHVCKNAGRLAITEWARRISDNNVGSQRLRFNITHNSAPALFGGLLGLGGQPDVSSGGTLYFQPAQQASGSADICMVLVDDGGTEFGGSDTSSPYCFRITVDPACDDGAGELFPAGFFDFNFGGGPASGLVDLSLGIGPADGLSTSVEDALNAADKPPLGGLFDFATTGLPPAASTGSCEASYNVALNNRSNASGGNAVVRVSIVGADEVTDVDDRCLGDTLTGNFNCYLNSVPTGTTLLNFTLCEAENETLVINAELESASDQDQSDNIARWRATNSSVVVEKDEKASTYGGGAFGGLVLLVVMLVGCGRGLARRNSLRIGAKTTPTK